MSGPCLAPWRTWFRGIDHASGLTTCAFGANVNVVREQNVHVVRIDLETAGLGFYTTPHSGRFQTQNETILTFLQTAYQLRNVKLAINGALAAAESGNPGAAASLFGLAKSCGEVVCDPTAPAPQPSHPKQIVRPDVPDARSVGTVALLITRDNAASFEIINAEHRGEGPPWPSTYTAVAGSPQPQTGVDWPPGPFVGGLMPGEAMVLRDGQNCAIASENGTDGEKVAGRTAVGLSQDRTQLFLLTIDGVEGAFPQYGAIFYDVAEWLLLAGAHDGITLDGGGSTAMAMINASGEPVLVNVPHGTEGPPYVQRANAQFLGVIPGE